jgi:NTP pyrophosphatase (non-canonical NTP hydrolase)
MSDERDKGRSPIQSADGSRWFPATPTTLGELQDRAIRDSRAWFPTVHATRQSALVHFALGIAGEVGELVNLIKKANRSDDFDGFTGEHYKDLAFEIADVAIYLLDIASELDIDLADAIEDKRAVLIKRWGAPEDGQP